MPDDRTLSLSTVTATIHAPIEKVDIGDWLFHLADAEYQRCSQAHIAAGTTTSDDGRAMSINVETIGDALVVQHYVSEVRGPHFCRMVSISDSISPVGHQASGRLGAQREEDRRRDLRIHKPHSLKCYRPDPNLSGAARHSIR